MSHCSVFSKQFSVASCWGDAGRVSMIEMWILESNSWRVTHRGVVNASTAQSHGLWVCLLLVWLMLVEVLTPTDDAHVNLKPQGFGATWLKLGRDTVTPLTKWPLSYQTMWQKCGILFTETYFGCMMWCIIWIICIKQSHSQTLMTQSSPGVFFHFFRSSRPAASEQLKELELGHGSRTTQAEA